MKSDDQVHIRQGRPQGAPSLDVLHERQANWAALMKKDPDTTYCGNKGKGVYDGLAEARAAGHGDADICKNCRLHSPA